MLACFSTIPFSLSHTPSFLFTYLKTFFNFPLVLLASHAAFCFRHVSLGYEQHPGYSNIFFFPPGNLPYKDHVNSAVVQELHSFTFLAVGFEPTRRGTVKQLM